MYKPKRPENLDGRRDLLTVNTWVFKMEQYSTLMNEFSSGMLASEPSKVAFASKFVSDSAAIWWHIKVSSGNVLDA